MKLRAPNDLKIVTSAVCCSLGFVIAAPAGEISPLSQTESTTASLWTYPTLTGDWGGLRTRLATDGVTFNVQYAAEAWSDVTGGESTGTVYTGLMTLQGNVDLQKLLGWQGASFSTRWYWLSGQDISVEHVGNIFTISSVAGFPTFRMNELWFQQNFLNNRFSIRIGQLGADTQFDLSIFSAVFLNSTFGWSPYLSANLPHGGSSYPFGVPGVQVALTPIDWLSYQGGVYQGNPFAQHVNRHGFRWDLSASNGYFSIHELIFRANQGPGTNGLPGIFKLGGWFDTAPDPDTGNTQPWNYGVYFVADQILYRVPPPAPAREADKCAQQATAAPSLTDKGLGIFTHIGLTPRNSSMINFYVDAGLNYKGLVPTRDNDLLGLGFAYGHLNNNPQHNQGINRGYEMVFEATYQIALTPWLNLQPDAQYVIHPSGTDIPNALVLGAHTTLSF